MYDKNDLLQFVDLMEASPDVEKQRAFIRMSPQDRQAYLYNLRAFTRSDELSLRKKSVLLSVQRALEQADRAARNAGR